MKDLISRQAAIDIVNKYKKSHMILWGKPMVGAASIVIELEELPPVQPEQRWIPCSEKDAEYPCLACDVFGQIFITDGGIVKINGECYDGTGFDFSNADEFLKGIKVGNAMRMLPRKIVAWLPLPEPDREEDGEEHDSY